MSGKPSGDVRSITSEELEQFLRENGEQRFRAGQIQEWLWKKGCASFQEMTTLSLLLRDKLAETFTFHVASPVQEQVSQDGSRKIAFRLHDNLTIEGVLIPAEGRTTACISSQVVCALGRTFCATGSMGFHRNLTAGEMADQVRVLDGKSREFHGIPLSNIVWMGMGEPLFNYPQVRVALDRLTSEKGMGISAQRITLSTVGIPKMIRQMADDQVKAHLAVSLHAASDAKRSVIIPFNRQHSLAELSESLVYYHQKTGKRITIEYLLLQEFNDSVADARELSEFTRKFPVKINLIEYNPVRGNPFRRSEVRRMKDFVSFLESRNLVVHVRKSRGKDIDAACGQLAANIINNMEQ